MFFFMKVLSTLLFLLLTKCYQNASATVICPAGQMRPYKTNYCVDCPENQYNPRRGKDNHCYNCSECGKGSKKVQQCTSTTDTRCKCMNGFTAIDVAKEEICACKQGSGVDKLGTTCSKCLNGYFSDKDDSTCQKWRECKSGIETPGTNTSDAVCKNAAEEETEAPKLYTTSPKTTVNYSTALSRTTAFSPTKDRSYSLLLILSCAGVLLLFGLLYYTCKANYCIHNFKKVDSRKESICRKPVEESGDKCLSSLV